MSTTEQIKRTIMQKYGQIAVQASPCCGSGSNCCGTETEGYSVINDDYSRLQGYVAEADLNLGCGLPTQHAGIKIGDTVVDLGSGAGNDIFIARQLIGESGKIIGIDMTPEMIVLAEQNNIKLGYNNIEFRLGEIEAIPVDNGSVDVVISNCVLNLVPDKQRAFNEIYRILKPGGHFCVSDVILSGPLPESLKNSAQAYAGCIAGALQEEEYITSINQAGFSRIEIMQRKKITLPRDLLLQYLPDHEIEMFHNSGSGIYSLTIVGHKL
jgi:arsenite methyltransferase